MERLAGVEPASSALATQRLRAVPEFTCRVGDSEGGVFLRKTPPGFMGFPITCNSGTAIPLDYSRSSCGTVRVIRTQTIRGSKDRCPAIRRSRSILPSLTEAHFTYQCQLLR